MSRHALLSVYDKSGIVDLAGELVQLGWRLLSSGGTARTIAEAGLPVTDVADLTGVPAILGHRVVTLHPRVHGGILADTSDPTHLSDMTEYGIEAIDLVVTNLYPFQTSPSIETIDIGGPAMVRAAAKNHDRVGVVVDPDDYALVLSELRTSGELSGSTRRSLARKAFAHTATYDAAIVRWLDAGDPTGPLPATLHLSLELAQPLRYGENPHQVGARYRHIGTTGCWDGAVQHGGKAMSYLNVFDAEAAWRLVHQFEEPAVVIVKHANPCGVAVGDDIATAYSNAHACDPVSAFGGVVALNRRVTKAVAEMLADVFTEVVVAPSFEQRALDLFARKSALRTVEAGPPDSSGFDLRTVDGGVLVQQRDHVSMDRSAWQVVTNRQPSDAEWLDLEFAWQVVAAVSSNAIVVARDRQAVGIGAGQQNRLDSARIAVEKAADRSTGAVAGSDAFFPFRDGLDALAASGVTAVIQPGGSVRDPEVVAAANEHGIAMVFTGERHFRH